MRMFTTLHVSIREFIATRAQFPFSPHPPQDSHNTLPPLNLPLRTTVHQLVAINLEKPIFYTHKNENKKKKVCKFKK